jgi:hypothetical protein
MTTEGGRWQCQGMAGNRKRTGSCWAMVMALESSFHLQHFHLPNIVSYMTKSSFERMYAW